MRLASQGISGARRPELASVADVVRWMTAMQAQDFPGAKWAVGVRRPGTTDAEVEAALADRSILRSWPLRGTLHFVASEDLHWMLSLTRDRMVRRAASTLAAEDLSQLVLDRAADAVRSSLAGARVMTRDEVYRLLAQSGVSELGQARYHALWYLCQTGVLCMGPPEGKSQTFVLLDEWVPNPKTLEHDEALGELALRYIRSHGPATDRDFSWWSSLTLTDARKGLAIVRDQVESREVESVEYLFSPELAEPSAAAGVRLLPGFDEYLLGYTDRRVALATEHEPLVFPGRNGMFLSTIVSDGAVVGTWKRSTTSAGVTVDLQPFSALSRRATSAARSAAREYARFLGKELREPA
jgi:hypothetical protein